MLELLQPTSTGSPYDEYLDARGEGIHHFGYIVEHFDRAYDHLTALGMRCLADGSGPGYPIQAYFLDGVPNGLDPVAGVGIELIEACALLDEFMAPVCETIGRR